MATIETIEVSLEAGMKMLSLTNKNADAALNKNKLRGIEKTLKQFEHLKDEVDSLKFNAQTLMFAEEKTDEEVSRYGEDIDARLEVYNGKIEELQAAVDLLQEEENKRVNNKLEQEELSRSKLRYEEEKKIEEMKSRYRNKNTDDNSVDAKPNSEVKLKEPRVKLPKLIITKFQGTHLDWLRFWNQFEVEIDRSELSPVSKFSYLKELLLPKVRLSVDGLPFTTEGYNRAKSILMAKYGKPSEVANAHVQGIIALPTIHHPNVPKIHEFYETLATNVQSLDTMGKLNEIKGYVRLTLDKLPCIRADLVRMDDEWQDWDFCNLLQALCKWTERNPISTCVNKIEQKSNIQNMYQQGFRREKLLQTTQKDLRKCIFCEATDHKATQCKKIVNLGERRKIISSKRLCFNCTGRHHQASECNSKLSCQKCDGRHHTSICDKLEQPEPALSTAEQNVIYPTVIVKVNGIPCRALLDTGSGSSYASTTLIERINKKPTRTVTKQIEMMLHIATKKIDIFQVDISDVNGKFHLQTEISKIEKPVLLTLPNPNSNGIVKTFSHLKGVKLDDTDMKEQLPIHLIIGASEYAKIKTSTIPRIGRTGEPVAEYTKFGWTIISPGQEMNLNQLYLTRSTSQDYEELCKLDVLGLEERDGCDDLVYEQFKKQLNRSQEGWYETSLIWKSDDLPDSNKSGSLGRLNNLVKKLERDPELFQKYDDIIQTQLNEGIVERVTSDPVGKEFYLPHRPVIRANAESTKVRIVYDGSAKQNESSKSLNYLLEAGPPLQNRLWDILLRCRLTPVVLCGDMKQAFLQIRIKEEDRDSLRFHWLVDKHPENIETLRFTRAIFGLIQSPFILNATIKEHLKITKEEVPEKKEVIDKLESDIYVDDIISGGNSLDEVIELKETAISTFKSAGLELHKWHSNKKQLESDNLIDNAHLSDDSYAKSILGVSDETKILGLTWDKITEKIGVTISKEGVEMTKRGLLKFLASIFDPLGIFSPITLMGKIIYREACDSKVLWDQKLPDELSKRFTRWIKMLPEKLTVPRSLTTFEEQINAIDLHVFADASANGVSAALYVIVHQGLGTTQGLLTSKSRLSKKDQTIPRLELIAVHMGANLLDNAKSALMRYPVRDCYGWSDSSVVLHWLRRMENYKQFVSNRINKVREKSYITWRHVPTSDNPADYGSRGCSVDNLPISWYEGPPWLCKSDEWPEDIISKATRDSEAEVRCIKTVLAAVVENERNLFLGLLEKYDLWKFLRITAWISRFISNCRKSEISGALTTDEIDDRLLYFIREAQKEFENDDNFKKDQLYLNLQKNNDELYECRGRLQGSFPIYLPTSHIISKKIAEQSHLRTLHGGVGLTMTDIRKRFWIPRLRQLVKGIRYHCNGCKRFHATSFSNPPPGNLPVDRVEGSRAFQVVGVDFAGPITYQTKNKKEEKSYVLLFACSLSRAIYLELLTDQTADSFIKSLKKFVSRRGRPEKIYSDNAKSFKKAAKWLYEIMKSEKLNDFLAHKNIKWQFNLSRAPWWGGQFERIIGLVKQSMYKTIGNSTLKFTELEEVLLDVEETLNNRPLSYVEDDIQMPVLTPNSLIFGQPSNVMPTEEESYLVEKDLRKRFKYIQKCKRNAWNRWSQEYVKGLRERHNLKHNVKQSEPKIGDVVIVKGETKNRGTWKLGVVTNVFPGTDGVVRAVELRYNKGTLQRPVQLLYPLELSCDVKAKVPLNANAQEFRPRRKAAEIAKIRISDQLNAMDDI